MTALRHVAAVQSELVSSVRQWVSREISARGIEHADDVLAAALTGFLPQAGSDAERGQIAEAARAAHAQAVGA